MDDELFGAVRMPADLQAHFKSIATAMEAIMDHPLFDDTARGELDNALMALAALKIRMYGIVAEKVPDQKISADDAMHEDPAVALRSIFVSAELWKRGMYPYQEQTEEDEE